MCDEHFREVGTGLGTGRGQKLEARRARHLFYVRTSLLVALASAGIVGEIVGWVWVLGGVDDITWP